jgi:hypothetical protein
MKKIGISTRISPIILFYGLVTAHNASFMKKIGISTRNLKSSNFEHLGEKTCNGTGRKECCYPPSPFIPKADIVLEKKTIVKIETN